MSIFKLPDLGEGLPEAEIREWLVKEGDSVKEDQPIVSMETAKAVLDVPSPFTGTIQKLHGKPGDIILTGAPLVTFEGSTEPSKDAGTVVGNIATSDAILKESAMGITTRLASPQKVKATPAVRKLANNLGIDLSTITGTGPQGSITEADLKQSTTPAGPESGFETLHGVRRSMAQIMSKAHQEVVPVTIMDDADIHHFTKETDISVRFIRSIIAACRAEPEFNAHFNGSNLSRKLFSDVNIAVAVDTPKGLYTPVIHRADQLSDKELREKINLFKELAKEANFSPEMLHHATITYSNVGIFAGRYASPIIIPPTVAIIATGRRREEVVPFQGKPDIHPIVPLSLTFDHRVITGGEAARFLHAMIEDLKK